MNLDPELAAAEYRERMVGPYRGVLPEATVRSMEEQLSGSCTMEIAAFDEFSRLLGDPGRTAAFDHVVFDTAPDRTHASPAVASRMRGPRSSKRARPAPPAWARSRVSRTSRGSTQASVKALADPERTTLVLVSRPEVSALREAERSSVELRELGVSNQLLILNGMFKTAHARDDRVAVAFERRGREALESMPAGIAALPRQEIRLSPRPLLGVEALRTMGDGDSQAAAARFRPCCHAGRCRRRLFGSSTSSNGPAAASS